MFFVPTRKMLAPRDVRPWLDGGALKKFFAQALSSEEAPKNGSGQQSFYLISPGIIRGNGRRKTAPYENKRGYRAEVRRERKKRDILSPVNVLH
jgi:hypothetical protein